MDGNSSLHHGRFLPQQSSVLLFKAWVLHLRVCGFALLFPPGCLLCYQAVHTFVDPILDIFTRSLQLRSSIVSPYTPQVPRVDSDIVCTWTAMCYSRNERYLICRRRVTVPVSNQLAIERHACISWLPLNYQMTVQYTLPRRLSSCFYTIQPVRSSR